MAIETTEININAKKAIDALGQINAAWGKVASTMTNANIVGKKLSSTGDLISLKWQIANKSGREFLVTANNLNKSNATLTVSARAVAKAATEQAAAAENARNKFNAARGDMNKLNKDARTFEVTWKSVAKIFTGRVVSAAISRITSGLSDALDYTIRINKEIASVRTIDVANLGYTEWSKQLREVSDAFGIDTVQQAQAAYQALSNQVVQGAETFKFLATANELALTGLSTTEQSVNLLSSIINAYGDDVQNAEEISAKLFKTVELGRVKIGNIADSFGRVAITGSQLGIQLNELLAFMVVTTNQGIKESEAMAALNGVMQKLLKPSKAMAEAFKDFGSVADATKVLGFEGVLRRILDVAEGSPAIMAELGGRVRAIRGFFAAGADDGLRFADALNQIGNSAEGYREKVNIATNNLGQNLTEEFTQIKNFFREDIFGAALNQVVGMVGGVENLDVAVKSLTKTIGAGLLATLAVSATRFLLTSTSIKSAIETLQIYAIISNRARTAALALNASLGPVGLAMAAVGVAVAGATYAYQRHQEELERLAKANREAGRAQIEAITKATEVVRQQLVDQRTEWDKTAALQRVVISRSIQEQLGLLSEVRREGVRAYTEQRDAAISLSEDGLKVLNDDVKKYTSNIKNAEQAIKAIDKANKATSQNVEDVIFEEVFDSKKAYEQVDILQERIDDLRRTSFEQSANADLLGFNESRKALNEMTTRLRELSKIEFVPDTQVNFDKLRSNAEEEIRLRNEIKKSFEDQKAASERGLETAQRSLETLKQVLDSLKQADLGINFEKPIEDAQQLEKEIRKISQAIQNLSGLDLGLEGQLKQIEQSYRNQQEAITKLNDYKSESAKLNSQSVAQNKEVDKLYKAQSLAQQQISNLQTAFNTRTIEGITVDSGAFGGSGPQKLPDVTKLVDQSALAGQLGITPELARVFNESLTNLTKTLKTGDRELITRATTGVLAQGTVVADGVENTEAQKEFLTALSQITGVSRQQIEEMIRVNASFEIMEQAVLESKTGIDDFKFTISEAKLELDNYVAEQELQRARLGAFGQTVEETSKQLTGDGGLATQAKKLGETFSNAVEVMNKAAREAQAAAASAKKSASEANSSGPATKKWGGTVKASDMVAPAQRKYGSDKVPHMLEVGEKVIPKITAMKYNKEFDHAIKYGELPQAVAKPEKVMIKGSENPTPTNTNTTVNVYESKSAELTGVQVMQKLRRAQTLRS